MSPDHEMSRDGLIGAGVACGYCRCRASPHPMGLRTATTARVNTEQHRDCRPRQACKSSGSALLVPLPSVAPFRLAWLPLQLAEPAPRPHPASPFQIWAQRSSEGGCDEALAWASASSICRFTSCSVGSAGRGAGGARCEAQHHTSGNALQWSSGWWQPHKNVRPPTAELAHPAPACLQ